VILGTITRGHPYDTAVDLIGAKKLRVETSEVLPNAVTEVTAIGVSLLRWNESHAHRFVGEEGRATLIQETGNGVTQRIIPPDDLVERFRPRRTLHHETLTEME